MKQCLSIVVAAFALTPGAFAVDQEYPPTLQPPRTTATTGSTETVQDTKIITDSGIRKTSTDTLTGKVEGYQQGKWIDVSTPGKIEGIRKIDLTGRNLTAHVASDVNAGDWVTVTVKTDNDGHKTIMVERSKHASRSSSR